MGRKLTFRHVVWLSLFHLVTLSPCHLVTAAYDSIDSPMYRLPELPAPPIVVVYVDAKELWLKALERPEAEMRYRAADAIALAKRRGVGGLESTVGPLRAVLDRPGEQPAVRLAVAQALIELNAREAAASLWQQAQAGGPDLREVVEPALARWRFRPAVSGWLARLNEPASPARGLVLAIRGLADVREGQAADRLRELALANHIPGAVRLEAAEAVGLLRAEGLEKDAERLAGDASAQGLVGRLAAAALLQRHRSEEAVHLLQNLVRDAEPAVTARAASRLLEIDPMLLTPALDPMLASPDAIVRALALEVLLREPTAERVRLLADKLDDPHPDVRGDARRALYDLADQPELRGQVLSEATRVLAAKAWRGQEQAAILLAALDHKPAATRLLALLPASRPEVYVTAAWGLRKLAVPETLPDVLKYVQARQRRIRSEAARPSAKLITDDHQLSQLNQLLGALRYAPSEAALREFIPRMPNEVCPEARAAAVWALGLIREGKPEPELVHALDERLKDAFSLPSEDTRVRRMAAVTLGRLKATDALDSLRRFYRFKKPALDPVNNACGWAIEQLTGEPVPPPESIRELHRDWFLAPHQ